jgi:hypothetical protein
MALSMKEFIKHLVEYIDEAAGQPVQVRPAPDAFQKLPVYIGQMLDIFGANLFDRPCHLLVFKTAEIPSPAEVAKLYDLVRETLKGLVIFVFPGMKSYERRRLVQRRVPFIVPRHQIYLPLALIDLRESTRTRLQGPGNSIEPLSGFAQTTLLYYLQKRGGADWPLNQWAQTLSTSAMNLSRVCKELAAAGLCKPERKGRKVILRLNSDRRALWSSACSRLRTPVMRVSPVRIADEHSIPLFDSGMTALARLTMIAEDALPVRAISEVAYRAARQEQKIEEQPFAEAGLTMLERWRYSPALLSPDGRMVDRLSLYLSLRDNPDERVHGALEEMLEGVQW